MKKFIKNNIVGFVIGAVLFTGITSFAYTMNAKQIAYEPTDNTWEVNNVSDAIDDIKEGFKPVFGTAQYSRYMGSQNLSNRTTSLTLNRGKYLINVISMQSAGNANTTSTAYEDTINYSCDDSKCVKTKIFGYYYSPHGSKQAGSGWYQAPVLRISTFYTEILVDNTTISLSDTAIYGAENGQVLALQASPIS